MKSRKKKSHLFPYSKQQSKQVPLRTFLKSENIQEKMKLTDNLTEIIQMLLVLLTNLYDYFHLCSS